MSINSPIHRNPSQMSIDQTNTRDSSQVSPDTHTHTISSNMNEGLPRDGDSSPMNLDLPANGNLAQPIDHSHTNRASPQVDGGLLTTGGSSQMSSGLHATRTIADLPTNGASTQANEELLTTGDAPQMISDLLSSDLDAGVATNGISLPMAADSNANGNLSHINEGLPQGNGVYGDNIGANMSVGQPMNRNSAQSDHAGVAANGISPPMIVGSNANGNSSHMNDGLPRGNGVYGDRARTNMSFGQPMNGNSVQGGFQIPQQRNSSLQGPVFKQYAPKGSRMELIDFTQYPTLHHLNDSQSQRMIWLLEELQIPYTLACHQRDENFRAPATFATYSPEYKKAPFLESRINTPYGNWPVGIPESSAIAEYLISRYDTNGKFGCKGDQSQYLRERFLVSRAFFFCHAASNMLMVDFGELVNGQYNPNFCINALRESLGHLSRELGHNPSRPFFMGAHPGLPDILIEWPMSMIHQRGWVSLEKEYPNLHAWLKTVYSREAWRRATDRGNGYDLKVFPKFCPTTRQFVGSQAVQNPRPSLTRSHASSPVGSRMKPQ